MLKFSRLALVLLVALVGSGTAAFAQETAEIPPPSEAAAAASQPSATVSAAEVGATEETPVVAAAAVKPANAGQLGFAFRARYVSVPSWFLGMFTQKNVPLSSYALAGEAFWRKQDKEDPNRTWEIVVSGGYQNMGPSDGIWLGRGKDINFDADLVQARGFGLITFDAAYVLRQYFGKYFGIHYGAGLGLGIVRGKILRTSAKHFADGTTEVVIPGQCGKPNPSCTDAQLKTTEGTEDLGPDGPHRYQETSVPSAIPIINLLAGIDFRIPLPDKSNLEFRLEGGFYDAFFVGATIGYVIRPL